MKLKPNSVTFAKAAYACFYMWSSCGVFDFVLVIWTTKYLFIFLVIDSVRDASFLITQLNKKSFHYILLLAVHILFNSYMLSDSSEVNTFCASWIDLVILAICSKRFIIKFKDWNMYFRTKPLKSFHTIIR